MLLTEQYSNQIAGVISCYDRVIIQGTLPGWGYANGMAWFLNSQHINIFDYPEFAKSMREEIRANAEETAKANGLEIEFIRKVKSFRKEARVKEILKERGNHPGLVHIFSEMEQCPSYRPWYDKSTKRAFLKPDSGKCLHYYFYFIDEEYGLGYLRVPTWCPFRLQFYFNGHNLLASKLSQHGISYELRDNAYLAIGDWEEAQRISDNIRPGDLHKVLDILAEKYCPITSKYRLAYQWTLMQVEYATDIAFKKQSDLHLLYDDIARTAIHSVRPDDIASFLGHKLTWNYQGEVGNNFNTRIQGTRIKHHMGDLSIKMYDKFGIILRIETTANDVTKFRHYREVQHRDGAVDHQVAPMKKNIYSLYPLAPILKASNRRYLEFISTFDGHGSGTKKLIKIAETVKTKGRSYKGFNFFSQQDQQLFETLIRGELNIKGFQNKTIRQFLHNVTAGSASRLLKRLRVHGVIRKVASSRTYHITKLGKAVISTGLKTRALLVIPSLEASI